MTAPAKAAPMREDVTPPYVVDFLRAVRNDPRGKYPIGSYYPADLSDDGPWPEPSWKIAEQRGWAISTGSHKFELTTSGLDAIAAIEATLAHTARPDAGDEDVERLRADIRNIQRNTAVYRQEARAEADKANQQAAEANARADRLAEANRVLLATFEQNPAAMREGVDRGMVERLREALKPFADAAEDVDEKDRDRDHLWEAPAAMNITVGNLRAAAAALSPEQPR